ncbi:cytochrome P450 [Halomonas korlensis]|uniref:Fatty-acid peroxygenase n=1 Tax=Halomonas korlensis TaxID=463301 RepID=A0A1I7K7W8_9GAMM|nr:cytochrome P450 [Halomonas korlensis]SFU93553.1 fatty-acid peroxygenase [Halomonas korlensis]
MAELPREAAFDSTLSFLREGYSFISRRCRRHGSDIFEARLMLEKTLLCRGEEAARMFYDGERFKREGAAPKRLQKTLFGEGAVQGLDGEKHLQRKELFMPLLNDEHIKSLVRVARQYWLARLPQWEKAPEVVLFDEMQEILCQGVCDWAGVPLAEDEVGQKTRDISLLIDSPAALGMKHLKGRLARKRTETWGASLVDEVRKGALAVNENTVLHRVAWHQESGGTLLAPAIAAVELLNILRPVVAVAYFITFAAHALYRHPECRLALQEAYQGNHEGISYPHWFNEEVRRYYPFFPCVVARVRERFEWKGITFPEGRRVILDLYGTNHHEAQWESPDRFEPRRFEGWQDNGFTLIPQGGGEASCHHRCPGEKIALGLMNMATRMLTSALAYEVPAQDLEIPYNSMPALPRSRFVINHVQASRAL